MTGSKKDMKKILSALPESSPKEIGYGNPPEHSRFKPGQSGNPRGRPRGAKNKNKTSDHERLSDIMLGEAFRLIKVNEGGKSVDIATIQAVTRTLAINAAKGDHRAQRLFIESVTIAEQQKAQLHEELLSVAIGYKLHWQQVLEFRKRNGIVADDPIPHPDHIIVDIENDCVRFVGPRTREEKADWDSKQDMKTETEARLAKLEQELLDATTRRQRKRIRDEIDGLEGVLKKIRAYLNVS